ncbi:MAG: hypothetical protein EPN91_13145 [Salinibacterium sp.]|nr:MAG: hypothetical protein EPN91_13145 [Salinibacterium sp.]
MLLTPAAQRRLKVAINDPSVYDEVVASLDNADQYALFKDYSVNGAKAWMNQLGRLILESNIRTNTAGNFNGGGTGNKPIAGLNLPELDGLPIAELPRLQASVALNTSAVAPKGQRGLSYNVFVDLEGNGNPADVVIMDITATLNAALDNGLSGVAASVTDFDIAAFASGLPPGTGRSYNTGPAGVDAMDNAFYIIYAAVPAPPVSTFYTGGPGYPVAWPNNPINLDMILNGGVMPTTGQVFAAKPNARLVGAGALSNYIATDGGMPAGIPVTPVTLQIGDSSLSLRCVSELTRFIVGSKTLIS